MKKLVLHREKTRLLTPPMIEDEKLEKVVGGTNAPPTQGACPILLGEPDVGQTP
jgi:hypothetical protein